MLMDSTIANYDKNIPFAKSQVFKACKSCYSELLRMKSEAVAVLLLVAAFAIEDTSSAFLPAFGEAWHLFEPMIVLLSF